MAKKPPKSDAPGGGIKGENARAALAGFCAALAASSQFQKASQEIDAFIADDTARESYLHWTRLEAQLDWRRERGLDLTAGEVHACQSARRTALGNPVVAAYLQANENLLKLKQSTLEWLDKTFELKRAPTAEDWKEEERLRAKEAKS